MTSRSRTGRTALRSRPSAVDYRDPSSDESLLAFDDDHVASSARPNNRSSRSTRTRTRAQPSRRAHFDDDNADFVATQEPPRKRVKPPPRAKASTASRRPSRRRLQSSSQHPSLKPTTTAAPYIPSDGRVPAWSTLPFDVLVLIFDYASYPLRDEHLQPLPSIMWLLRSTTVCKAYTDPVLTVLYRDPPLVDLGEPHRLLALLRTNPDSWRANYAAKIKTLRLDARRTLKFSVTGLGLINLPELIGMMPQLLEIDITDPIDRPPYRHMTQGTMWTYPPDLFSAMNEHGIQLLSWKWNETMIKPVVSVLQDTEEMITATHRSPSFKKLKHLSMSHFKLDRAKPKSSSRNTTAVANDGSSSLHLQENRGFLDKVLQPLDGLCSLELLSCQTELWSPILTTLPQHLEHLTISNTPYLTSEDMRIFLDSHGRRLKTLVLDHNQSLSLSFLTDLASSCPCLESIHMDLTYYSAVTLFKDSDPLFDVLLAPDEIATWPSTLESIELIHLRQWASGAAEQFFLSLLEAAERLPRLRTLVIKAILNINWRDRAGFRNKWIGRLQRVFLDRSPLPDRSLASFKAYRLARGIYTDRDAGTAPTSNAIASVQPNAPSAADATGIRAILSEHDNFDDNDDAPGPSQSDSPSKASRRSTRIREHTETASAAARAAAELAAQHMGAAHALPGSPGTDDNDDDEWAPVHVQGRCNTVDVSIDNLRPSEVQFNERDFLDDEASGDEDWTGDDARDAGTGYAW